MQFDLDSYFGKYLRVTMTDGEVFRRNFFCYTLATDDDDGRESFDICGSGWEAGCVIQLYTDEIRSIEVVQP